MLSERARLVRLCAHLSGSPDAAEDLAQETLLEAWRNAHKLYDDRGVSHWLNAIARVVCMRWARSAGRELSYLAPRHGEPEAPADACESLPAPLDLEVELERDELAELLDRALGLLPPDTREVLVRRFVQDSPHAEIAARMGCSEGAVKLRLHRGKLALQKLLTTQLAEEAASHGIVDPVAAGGWEETRIWCMACGRRRLVGRFDRAGGQLTLRCPTCNPNYLREPSTNMAHLNSPEVLAGVRGYRAGLTRIMDYAYSVYAPALESRVVSCPSCGRHIPLRMGVPEYVPRPLWTEWGMHFRCEACGDLSDICLAGLVFWMPEGRRFWRRHPRVRLLPERQVEVGGQPAIVTSFESVGGGARFDAVCARDTFRVLATHGAPAPAHDEGL
jgi:RNA polymerase sigma-70 factor (ECF subfamily)